MASPKKIAPAIARQKAALLNPAAEPAATPTEVLYREVQVAESLGLSRERLTNLRTEHLFLTEHFRLVRGEVVLTEAGLAEVVRLVGLAATEALDIKAGPPARALFTVTRVPASKHLLFGLMLDAVAGTKPVLIRVKDNANFMRGMRLEALEGAGRSWQYRGRLPRKKGRW